jgi:hypothetical protein
MGSDLRLSNEWRALHLEADLSSGQLAMGATALGKANYAQQGLYTQAFFGLSIGMERLAKMILIGDHVIQMGGTFPTNAQLKSYGHDLRTLLNACEPISVRYRNGMENSVRPVDAVHRGIVETLAEFAIASRYYNLDSLTLGAAPKFREPISAWWDRVGMPILDKHYTDKQRHVDDQFAELASRLLGANVITFHISETGQRMDDVRSTSSRARATLVVQRFGRLYTLQIVRWLASLIAEICNEGSYCRGFDSLFGHHEYFYMFRLSDSDFLRRKRWANS